MIQIVTFCLVRYVLKCLVASKNAVLTKILSYQNDSVKALTIMWLHFYPQHCSKVKKLYTVSCEPVVVKYWSTLHPLCFVPGLSEQTGNTRLSEAGPEASLSSWSLILAEPSQPEEENKPVAEQRREADHKSHQQWAKTLRKTDLFNVEISAILLFFPLSPSTFPTGTCPKLDAPSNGRKLGKSHGVGHEVHFLCDPGYELAGSESRVCQESLTWSGQQTTCRGESPTLIFCYWASPWWSLSPLPPLHPLPTSVSPLFNPENHWCCYLTLPSLLSSSSL